MIVVVVFHTLLYRITLVDGHVELVPWAAPQALYPLTWVLMIMPLFFVAGGFGNTLTVDRMYREHTSVGHYLAGRGRRLVGPLVVFVSFCAVLATAAAWLGWLEQAADLSRALMQLLWFITVYLVIVAFAPGLVRLHDRFGVVPMLVLAALALAAWLWIWRSVHEPVAAPAQQEAPRESVREAVLRFAALFTVPHTWGIVVLGAVTYAALISMRGLWLGPMLIERHGFSLVQSGNVALALSVVALCGPMLFGRIDPGPARRRRWIVTCTLAMAVLFAAMVLPHSALLDVACMLAVGLLSGFIVLQYADVRAAYPAALTGRAMAVFTMAMFLGVAAMQWLTGLVASLAKRGGTDPYLAVMASIAVLLALAALAFRLLPPPPRGER